MLQEKELLEIFPLVFSSSHSIGFKRDEIKSLLFDPSYTFLEIPKLMWLDCIYNYFGENGIDKSILNINSVLISWYERQNAR